MSDALEVRPTAFAPEDFDAFVGTLEGASMGVNQSLRLVGRDGASIELPASIHTLLVSVVDILKQGDGVLIIPLHAELTTVQAAEVLNVSRPHLIKQVEAGSLPHHMVGTHRRLRLLDVLAYRDQRDAQANDTLEAMTAEAEDLGLYE
jgi:excisionase family DNA binding protein